MQEHVEAARALFSERGSVSVAHLQAKLALGYESALRVVQCLKDQASPEVRGEQTTLPVNNALFPENRRHGLMLCGINHGHSSEDERLDALGARPLNEFKSFFSDKRVEDHDFRNAIVKWFRLWGYHLQADWRLAQAFDKSLLHTNWIQSATRDTRGMNVRKACIEDSESFLNTCEVLRPGLIVFFSQQLTWAFTSHELRARVEALFGPSQGPTEWIQEQVPGCVRFRVGFHRYRDLQAVSLPHCTGARVADKYIEALEPRMRAVIDKWWHEHRELLRSPRAL
jgi:hypothetical protein